MATGLGSFILGSVFLALFFGIISILSFVFWIFMLLDSVKRKYKHHDDKIVWILVIVLAGVIGALIYYFAVKRKGKR
ncbi:MAG: PLDc N-terminal domain-containing protein [Candidatus Nanoarchaeia archaeon]|nr:PLDc N-terminal domain-containing protein [Candidatus Nanoarchaeia archaeon]